MNPLSVTDPDGQSVAIHAVTPPGSPLGTRNSLTAGGVRASSQR